jgi:Lon protease-like protein
MMFHELPSTLPLFPLSGVLLLPGGSLPLHVFEPRYRNLLEDARAADSMIGIIQPQGTADVFADDLPPLELDLPRLYDVGCVGLVERCEPISHRQRYMVVLRGICRFRVDRELDSHRGYRRIEADYDEFVLDEETPSIEAERVMEARVMEALVAFGAGHHIAFELDRLRDLSGLTLLNSVAMALPFAPEEKQALLEAPDVERRLETLLTLMKMGLEFRGSSEPAILN